jgi:hypothetical protein
VIVLRPGDPSPDDFDPADAAALSASCFDAAGVIFENADASLALALGAASEMYKHLPSEALEAIAALISAELASR